MMYTYEEAKKEGNNYRSQIDSLFSEFKRTKRHPIIGLIEGYAGTVKVRSSKYSRPLRIKYLAFTSFLAIASVAYGSIYRLSTLYPTATESVFVYTAKTLIPEYFAKDIMHGLRCATRRKVHDKDFDLLGYKKPYPNSCNSTKASHRTSPLTKDAISKLNAAQVVLEGDYFGNGSVLGFHLKTPARVLLSFSGWGDSIPGAGGSTPLETAQKNILGVGGQLSVFEKIGSILRLGATSAYIAPDKKSRDRLVAENMPCLTGGANSALGGVLAGDFCGLIFGRNELGSPTWGEACLVVASGKYLTRVLGLGAKKEHIAYRDQQFDSAKHRGKVCLQRLEAKGIISQELLTKEMPIIDGLAPPKPRPNGYYNPDKMFSENVPGLISPLDVNQKTGPINLTIDREAQQSSGSTFSRQLPNILNKTNHELCFGTHCPDNRQLDHLLFIGEITDENQIATRVLYETRFGLFSGPSKGPSHRSLGSLGKALVAPLIANEDIHRICLKPIFSLHDNFPINDFGGSNNCKEHTYSMFYVYKTSSNIGVANALLRVEHETLKSYLVNIGASFNSSISGNQLRRGVTVGDNVTLSPKAFTQAFTAIANNGNAQSPILIQNKEGLKLSIDSDINKQAYKTSLDWLQGPLSPGGTANLLGKYLNTLGCRNSIAKTGTSDSFIAAEYRDKLISFQTTCGNRKFIVFSMIGSPDITVPLGKGIRTSTLIKLLWPSFKIAAGY